MFEIPDQVYGLMQEYETLIKKYLKIRNKKMCHSLCSHLDQCLSSISELDILDRIESECRQVPWFSNELDKIKNFVEDRIGEDFVVLPSEPEKVFCLHGVEDFLLESEKNEFYESKKGGLFC